MQVLKRFHHLPSGSTYAICLLTTPEMKNRAFALLYRKYIAEAKVPWDYYPPDNPSKLRVERRVVDGADDVPVLVDDFEHTGTLCGVVSESDGRLVGTIRMLLRCDMPDGRLEMERYEAFTDEFRRRLRDERCDIEFNRFALEDGLRGARSALLSVYALLSGVARCERTNGSFAATTSEGFMRTVEDRTTGFGARYVGSFKYADADPAPAVFLVFSKLDLFVWGNVYALGGGSLLIGQSRMFTAACDACQRFSGTFAGLRSLVHGVEFAGVKCLLRASVASRAWNVLPNSSVWCGPVMGCVGSSLAVSLGKLQILLRASIVIGRNLRGIAPKLCHGPG